MKNEPKIEVIGDLQYYGLEMVNRVHSTDGLSPTLRANSCSPKIEEDVPNRFEGMRIRILTPRETWRLQGFKDTDYDKAVEAGATKTDLYKQSGNSIAVPCLEAIFKALYIDKSYTKTFDITKY